MDMSTSISSSDSSLYGFIPTPTPPLGALLEAIESNSVHQPATSLGAPAFTSFLEPGVQQQAQLPPHMNITSLLAASQELSVPSHDGSLQRPSLASKAMNVHHPFASNGGGAAAPAPAPAPMSTAGSSSSTSNPTTNSSLERFNKMTIPPSTPSTSAIVPVTAYNQPPISMMTTSSSTSTPQQPMSNHSTPSPLLTSSAAPAPTSVSKARSIGPTNLHSASLPIQQAWATLNNALGAFQDGGRQVDFTSAAYSNPTVEQLLRQASNSPSMNAISTGPSVSSLASTSATLPMHGSPQLSSGNPSTGSTPIAFTDPISPSLNPTLSIPSPMDNLPAQSTPLMMNANSTIAGSSQAQSMTEAAQLPTSMTWAAPALPRALRNDTSPFLAHDSIFPLGPPASNASTNHKRRRSNESGPQDDDRHTKIRRCIESSIMIASVTSPALVRSTAIASSSSSTPAIRSDPSPTALTTILCLHASIGQKSYGNEKRFLNPPPMVRIVGPLRRLSKHPRISMDVVSDLGMRCSREQGAVAPAHLDAADPNARTYFRSLHVGKSGKAKTFKLEMSLHPSDEPAPPETPVLNGSVKKNEAVEELENEMSSPLAAFTSGEMQIISKPSKKTAKARSTDSCLFAGSTIALYNRINAQTVRTKFAIMDEGDIAAQAHQWTAFSIQIVKRAEETNPELTDTLVTSTVVGGSQTVTYGSEISLTDLMTGATSEPLIVRKVERGMVHLGASGPVAQLQKLALARVTDDGTTIYLSASPDGLDKNGKVRSSDEGSSEGRKGGKRNGAGTTSSSGSPKDDNEPGHSKVLLTYQTALKLLPPDDQDPTGYELITDYLTWTVVGIDSFSYSFFDAYGDTPVQQPLTPITPFPVVRSEVLHDPTRNTLSMSISDFMYAQNGGQSSPLQVWLGPIGPLHATLTKAGTPLSGTEPATLSFAPPKSGKSAETSQTPSPPNRLITLESSPSEIVVDLPSLDSMLQCRARIPSSPVTTTALDELINSASSPGQHHPIHGSASMPLIVPVSETKVTDAKAENGGVVGVTLPLILIREKDGIGYQMGKSVVIEPAGRDEAANQQDWTIKIV